jgi:thioredoxin reductase
VPGAPAGRVEYVAGHQAWFVEPGADASSYTLHLTPSHAGAEAGTAPRQVRARALVLCPGGYDRQLPVPGWDLPGVMTAGGVQALLKGHRSVAGRRAVVAGTGPFLLPVAAGLAEAGAQVVAVCEANAVTGWARSPGGACAVPSKGLEALGYAAALARHRIPLRQSTAVTAVHGDEQVSSVTLSRLDRDGRVRTGVPARDLDVDLVAFGWGFTPSLELLTAVGARTRMDVDESLVVDVDDWQRTDVRGVYAAGEATGVGGALLALAEGELAGLAAALDAGRTVAGRRIHRRQRAVRRSRRFAAAMHRAHPVPAAWDAWVRPDTLVCRCEEVTCADVHAARDELGATDARTVKLLARPGMGWCQGRVCGYATAKLAAAGSGRPLCAADLAPNSKRPIAAPVSLGELADSWPAGGPPAV